jgi:hypothetical protein
VHRERITCHDMTKESRFDARFVELCLQHGVHSLQSRLVFGRDQRPIGTFVMACNEARSETDFDSALMKFAADATGAILQKNLDA